MCVRLRNGLDPEKVRRILLDSYGTGLIAGQSVLRIAFSAVGKGLIEELYANIYKACGDSVRG